MKSDTLNSSSVSPDDKKDSHEDVLLITPQDMIRPLKKCKKCIGTTLKGKKCKNKIYRDFDYCKRHYNKFRLEKPTECPVCMESLDDVKIPLSCSHWVHRECIIKWGKDKCPVCRADIKLTIKERQKIHMNNHRDNNTDNTDIVLPQQLIDFLDSFVTSFSDELPDGFILNVNIRDNEITLMNDEEDDMMSSTEFS